MRYTFTNPSGWALHVTDGRAASTCGAGPSKYRAGSDPTWHHSWAGARSATLAMTTGGEPLNRSPLFGSVTLSWGEAVDRTTVIVADPMFPAASLAQNVMYTDPSPSIPQRMGSIMPKMPEAFTLLLPLTEYQIDARWSSAMLS